MSRDRILSMDFERYEFREGARHVFELDRREFFKLFGAGLAVVAVAPSGFAQERGESGRTQRRGEDMPQQISAWLHIGEDGAVTVYTGKAEMGQGIRTSLTQQVAEELRVPVSSISMIMADTALTPFDMGTFGSRTTPQMGTQLRRISAGARQVLLARAANVWSGATAAGGGSALPQSGEAIDVEQLSVADGKITNRATGQSLTYAQLVRGQHLLETVVADPQVTAPASWHVAGTPTPRVDVRAFVTGEHQYASDIRRPGMLHGKVLRPTAFNAKLASLDDSAANQLPQVTVVRDGEFIGVAAPSQHAAQAALAKLNAQWNAPPQVSNAELFKQLKSTAKSGEGVRVTGSIEQGLAQAAKKLESTYTVQYIQHAPLEPRAAVAEWSPDGKLTVWTGSQRPFGVREELANAFHLAPENVRVIVPDTGSAYGGKHTGECAIEAARLAKAAGKPVKLVWTREEEFTWAYFRPAGVIEVRSGATGDGKLTAWEFHNYNSGPSAIETRYDCPNQHIEFHPSEYPLRQGSYRGLAATANHFARESHMDELAHAVALDPLEFRLRNIKQEKPRSPSGGENGRQPQFEPERLRAVFEAAAEKFGWGRKKPGNGAGYGIAGGFEKGGYVACAAEVEVTLTGQVKILRVVEAWDSGPVVNPEGLRNTITGAIIQGIGGALFEAVQFRNGKILNPHFAEYRVPRFADAPKIEIVLIDRKDRDPFGAGETPIVGIAPAVAEAIFGATGKRLRDMPLAPNGVDCGCEVKS